MEPNNVKTTHACLPVTALQVLRFEDISLILSGQGSVLSVIEPQSRTLLACRRTFASSSVHGIACDSWPPPKHAPRGNSERSLSQCSIGVAKLVVWGGSSVCFARLRISCEGLGTVGARITIDEFEVGATVNVHDWILDGSLAYSAPSSDVQACLGTAHNEVLVLPFPRSSDSPLLESDCPPGNANICGISTSVKPFFYSARVRVLRPGSFGVLGGTAFGEVCGWNTQPRQNSSQPVELSTGHQGIVFGVDQCEKWLATCSDDRGVRLGVCGTRAPLVETWRHTSRVWGVKLIRTSTGALCLVSVGEDNVCKVQQIANDRLIELVDDRYHGGKNIWSVADAHCKTHQVITGGADGGIVSRDVSTGAAQSFPKATGSYFDHGQLDFKSLFAQLESEAVTSPGPRAKTPFVKQYMFTSHTCLLVLTDSGYLYSISKREGESVDKIDNYGHRGIEVPQEWPIFSRWSIQRKYNYPFGPKPVLSDSEDHLAFVGDEGGKLFVCLPTDEENPIRLVTQLDIALSWLAIAAIRRLSDLHRECCIVVYSKKERAAKVVVARLPIEAGEGVAGHAAELPPEQRTTESRLLPTAPSHPQVWTLDLPEDFVPTSARLLNLTGVLVLGSRTSALAIYRPLAKSGEPGRFSVTPLSRRPLLVNRVHESDSVTSIQGILPADDATGCTEEHFLTTGRNGTYAVHSVTLGDPGVASTLLDVVTSPFSSGIEGCYCIPTQESQPGLGGSPRLRFGAEQYGIDGSGRAKTGDLVLYGFDSERFVIWNESRQSLIFSIACGNLHRAWAYNKYPAPRPQNHGAFAWTQAGLFHLVDIAQTDHSTIQQGGHGREIKALSVSPLPYQHDHHDIRGSRLVATGAEDTTIRFFAVGPTETADARNALTLVRTVKKHNTGIQCLSFSTCGRYLFSSGGCEELYAWRIRHGVPAVNLGVVLTSIFPQDTTPPNPPPAPTTTNSDLRITDFKIQDYPSGTFLVSAVYSNSMIKVFHFRPDEPDRRQSCHLRQRFFYRDNCLTQIIHGHPDTGTLTASTDGHLALWPVHGPEPGQAKYAHRLHQNSIHAMRAVDLPRQPPADLHTQLVLTGGDDNALGLTLIRMHPCPPPAVGVCHPVFQSLRIPHAHAAAITAICVVTMAPSASHVTVHFLTAGKDQRVKLWQTRIAVDALGRDGAPLGGSADMGAVDVDLVASAATDVADVAAMELVTDDGPRWQQACAPGVATPVTPTAERAAARVMVVGVGMEVLEFPAAVPSAK